MGFIGAEDFLIAVTFVSSLLGYVMKVMGFMGV